MPLRGPPEELLDMPGVVGVGGTDPGGRDEIIVYVESPVAARAVPRVYAGVPVRVIVTGKVRVFSARTGRVRPVVGGVSVSDPTGTAGTLAAGAAGLLLTNAHVAGIDYRSGEPYPFMSRTPWIQPGRYDGGDPERDAIGEHVATVLDEYRDMAVARATMAVRDLYVLGLGYIRGWTDPRPRMIVYKSGRTTGVRASVVIDTNAVIKIYGYPGGPRVFRRQVVVANPAGAFMLPGDSGSLLVTRYAGALLATGLCFAGSESIAVANNIRYIVERGWVPGPYVPLPPRDWLRYMWSLPWALSSMNVPLSVVLRRLGLW